MTHGPTMLQPVQTLGPSALLALSVVAAGCYGADPLAVHVTSAVDAGDPADVDSLEHQSSDSAGTQPLYVVGDPLCEYESRWPRPRGKLVASLKVMTTNIYGQSQDLGNFFTTTDGECQDRLRQIGEYIRDASPAYDIVGVQEWHPDSIATCNGVVMANRFDDIYSTPSTGYYPAPPGFEWGQYRWAQPEAYDQNDGGLGLVSPYPFLWEQYDEADFDDDVPVRTANVHQFYPRLKPRTAHGFVFARIYLDYPDVAVDTYVVHIASTGGDGGNSCDDSCKEYMLEQLREGIHERSANSGFPVLVMGDFNIGGPNPTTAGCEGNRGYGAIKELLGNPVDVWLEAHSGQAGSTHHWWDDQAQRIDFMFLVDDSYLTNSDYELVISDPASVRRLNWADYLPTAKPSDHMALEAVLEVRVKLDWATVLTAVL